MEDDDDEGGDDDATRDAWYRGVPTTLERRQRRPRRARRFPVHPASHLVSGTKRSRGMESGGVRNVKRHLRNGETLLPGEKL